MKKYKKDTYVNVAGIGFNISIESVEDLTEDNIKMVEDMVTSKMKELGIMYTGNVKRFTKTCNSNTTTAQ